MLLLNEPGLRCLVVVAHARAGCADEVVDLVADEPVPGRGPQVDERLLFGVDLADLLEQGLLLVRVEFGPDRVEGRIELLVLVVVALPAIAALGPCVLRVKGPDAVATSGAAAVAT